MEFSMSPNFSLEFSSLRHTLPTLIDRLVLPDPLGRLAEGFKQINLILRHRHCVLYW